MITVVGASGFIGSHVVRELTARGENVAAPTRSDVAEVQGHVVYCAGVRGNPAADPVQTVDANVSALARILDRGGVSSLTYVSSTRVYHRIRSVAAVDESMPIEVDPADLYVAAKLAGEALALGSGLDRVAVVRVSNVFGMNFDTARFVPSLISDALRTGEMQLRTTADSDRDYVSVHDVASVLAEFAVRPPSGIFNLAYGENLENEAVAEHIARLTGAVVHYAPDAHRARLAPISTRRLAGEIGFRPSSGLIDALPALVSAWRGRLRVR